MADVPSFEFSGSYYFDLLRSLLQYARTNIKELTDESDEEPYIQLLKAWALIGHYCNVRLDVAANESLLPTALLLESVRSQLKLIGYEIPLASPATVDILLKFSSLFTSPTLIVPENSQFATEDTDENPQVIFEATQDYTVSPTDKLTYVFGNQSVSITLSNKNISTFDYVSSIVPVVGDLIYQSGNYAIVVEVVDANTIRLNDGSSITNGAATLGGTNFGTNKITEATTPALTFTVNGAEPDPLDYLYLGHDTVMWDQLDLVFNHTFKTGVAGVWEYYDGSVTDENPDSVTNLGSQLEFDLTTLLGTEDRSGTIVRVTYVQSSVVEDVVSIFSGGINKAVTTGLLGQVTPSTSRTDYLVGSIWAPLDVTDTTNGDGEFTNDGSVTFEIPQTIKKNWQKTTINGVEAFWLRFRTQSLTKTAAEFTGTGFNALGLDSSNYNVKIKIDGFAATEIDVTGDLGASPGTYTLASVQSAINTALNLVDVSLSTACSIVGGQLKLTAPDPTLGKDSLIQFQAPSSNDATLEVFGLAEFGYPKSYIGIGGTPVFDTIDISEGNQYILVEAVQGSTVVEDPLGSSDGTSSQEFTLGHSPLIDGTLLIEVDEGSGFTQYDEVDNFLNSDLTSKHYTLEVTADDVATITFGDGVNGKIPPVGVDNIRATYRIGADEDGNVGARTVIVNLAGISFVADIYNPRAGSGWVIKQGVTEESLALEKIKGPASIRTLDRGITPADIEYLAQNFTSSIGSKPVARAKSVEETFGVKTVELIVVGNGGVLLTEAQKSEIDEYFNGNSLTGVQGALVSNHEVTTVNYTPRVINVDVTTIGGNAESIKNALTALLNPEAKYDDGVTYRWDFGGEVPRSLIIAAIHETDPTSVKKVTLTQPAADITLNSKELPLAGTLTVTIT